MTDRDFLLWIHDRLTCVYHEEPRMDYMHKLRSIIANVPREQESRNVGVYNNAGDLRRAFAEKEHNRG